MVLRLPNELILQVVSYLPNVSDKHAFLLTTKQLTGLLQPVLNQAAKAIQEEAIRQDIELMHHAAFHNDCRMAKLALKMEPECVDAFMSEHGTPLHLAIGNGHLKMVCFLLEHGANPNALYPSGVWSDTPLNLALENLFIRPWEDPEIRQDFVDIAQELLLAGADPNQNGRIGYDALHQAVTERIPELVEAILDTAQVNINKRTAAGSTALHLAAGMRGIGAIEVVKVLLERGIHVNARNHHGETALFHSTCPEITRLLIDYGTDVNISDYQDKTVLHVRADSWNYEFAIKQITALLLCHFPIKVLTFDNTGHSPVDYAIYNNNLALIKIFADYDKKLL